jgi:hypothetical protein
MLDGGPQGGRHGLGAGVQEGSSLQILGGEPPAQMLEQALAGGQRERRAFGQALQALLGDLPEMALANGLGDEQFGLVKIFSQGSP